MLKLRLSRGGTKKRPVYKIVVAESRFARDGRFIEKLGFFNPLLPKEKKERIGLESERIKYWLSVGAKPSERVQKFLANEKLAEKPIIYEQTKQDKPRKKTLEKIKAKEEKDKAKIEMEKAAEVAVDPLMFWFPKFLLSFVYLNSGQLQEVEDVSKSILNFSEKRSVMWISTAVYLSLAPALIAKGHMKQGIRMLEETHQIMIRNQRRVWCAQSDYVLGFFGLIMQLGPILNWGLNINKKTVEVNTENFETNVDSIFAIGDICSYPGKLKLILSGFHEGALAARACFKLAKPDEKYRFEFTTSSKAIKNRLGVKDD